MESKEENRLVRLGVIGVGGRALGLIDSLAQMPGVEVSALCDIIEDRMQDGIKIIRQYAD